MRNRLTTSSTHRALRRSLLAGLVVAAGACGGGSTAGGSPGTPTSPTTPTTPSNPTATTAVTLLGSAFTPQDIQVAPSAVVTFTNNDQTAHNVIFTNTSINGVGDWSGGDRTVTMPATTGSYAYHCSIHAGMSGSVTVK